MKMNKQKRKSNYATELSLKRRRFYHSVAQFSVKMSCKKTKFILPNISRRNLLESYKPSDYTRCYLPSVLGLCNRAIIAVASLLCKFLPVLSELVS